MNIALHVTASPHHGQTALSALRFAQAALAQGHQVSRVFFSGDGVLNALRAIGIPGTDRSVNQWQSIACTTELIACISACMKRGVFDDALSTRYRMPVTLAEGFIISGLGQLAESVLVADRVVTFG